MPRAKYRRTTVKLRRKPAAPKRTRVEVYYRNIPMSKGVADLSVGKAIKKVLESPVNLFKQKRRGH